MLFDIKSSGNGFRISLDQHFVLIQLGMWHCHSYALCWWEIDTDQGVPNIITECIDDAMDTARAQLLIMRAQARANPQPKLTDHEHNKNL